jgi:hypothetical protein
MVRARNQASRPMRYIPEGTTNKDRRNNGGNKQIFEAGYRRLTIGLRRCDSDDDARLALLLQYKCAGKEVDDTVH